jgi:hypothetical protein
MNQKKSGGLGDPLVTGTWTDSYYTDRGSQALEPLPAEIRKHHRTMRQVWRDENTAIYEYFGGFEVIVIVKAPAEQKFGRDYPARELYPGDEDWGTLAITRPESDSLEYRKKRAHELYHNAPKRHNRLVTGRVKSSGSIKVADSSGSAGALPRRGFDCYNPLSAEGPHNTHLETTFGGRLE